MTASAPASSANLGPGFDFLALALDLRCRVSVTVADEWAVPTDAAAIVKAIVGGLGIAESFSVTVDSDVPVGRGLGSSAALGVAAGAAALAATGRQHDPDALFRAAAAVEGHPDNAAAATYGGLVAVSGSGPRRLMLSPELMVVLAVPNTTLATAEAREALPTSLPHAAAARSASRAAYLIEGLRTGDANAFAEAAGDELHERPRGHLSPITGQLIEAAKGAGALHAAWSGAGPSVVAFAVAETVDGVAATLETAIGTEGVVMRPAVASSGVSVSD